MYNGVKDNMLTAFIDRKENYLYKTDSMEIDLMYVSQCVYISSTSLNSVVVLN